MTAEEIRLFIIDALQTHLENAEVNAEEINEHFDLFGSGLIDSMRFLTLIVEIEEWVDVEINFEDLDPDKLTKIGSLCQFVEAQLEKV